MRQCWPVPGVLGAEEHQPVRGLVPDVVQGLVQDKARGRRPVVKGLVRERRPVVDVPEQGMVPERGVAPDVVRELVQDKARERRPVAEELVAEVQVGSCVLDLVVVVEAVQMASRAQAGKEARSVEVEQVSGRMRVGKEACFVGVVQMASKGRAGKEVAPGMVLIQTATTTTITQPSKLKTRRHLPAIACPTRQRNDPLVVHFCSQRRMLLCFDSKWLGVNTAVR